MQTLVLIFCFILCSRVEGQVDGDLRLNGFNSNSYQGRVEIYKNNIWGTVCSRHFAQAEAQVVCRQLGVRESDIDGSQAILDGRFGAGTGEIFIDDVKCHGYETHLLNCMFSFWSHNCDDTSQAAVICTAPPVTTPITSRPYIVTTQPSFTAGPPSNSLTNDYGQCINTQLQQVRLIGPQSMTGAGVVQVLINGQWRGISGDTFNRAAAQVICRMLCYDVPKAVPGSDPFNTSSIPSTVVLDNVDCTGSEPIITGCAFTTSFTNTNELARVTCVDMATSTLTDSISPPVVECDNGEITAIFNASWSAFVPNSQVSLVRQSTVCNARRQLLTDSITISIPFDECGTSSTWNSSHIIYENSVLYVPAPVGIITRIRTYMLYLICELPRDFQSQRDLVPISSAMEQSGQANFTVWMYFYTDNFNTRITQYPLQVPVGDWLQVGMEMFEYDRNTKLVLYSCWATPSSDRNHHIGYPLFTDKCEDDPTVTLFCLSNLQFGFRYQTFKFTQYNEVHIHCEAYVCPLNDTSPECDCSCHRDTQGIRKKRSITRDWIDVKSTVIMMYDPAENQNNFAQYAPTPPSHTTPSTTHVPGDRSRGLPSTLTTDPTVIAVHGTQRNPTPSSTSKPTINTASTKHVVDADGGHDQTSANQDKDHRAREETQATSDASQVTNRDVENKRTETLFTSRVVKPDSTKTPSTSHVMKDNRKEAATTNRVMNDDGTEMPTTKQEAMLLTEEGFGVNATFESLLLSSASPPTLLMSGYLVVMCAFNILVLIKYY